MRCTDLCPGHTPTKRKKYRSMPRTHTHYNLCEMRITISCPDHIHYILEVQICFQTTHPPYVRSTDPWLYHTPATYDAHMFTCDLRDAQVYVQTKHPLPVRHVSHTYYAASCADHSPDQTPTTCKTRHTYYTASCADHSPDQTPTTCKTRHTYYTASCADHSPDQTPTTCKTRHTYYTASCADHSPDQTPTTCKTRHTYYTASCADHSPDQTPTTCKTRHTYYTASCADHSPDQTPTTCKTRHTYYTASCADHSPDQTPTTCKTFESHLLYYKLCRPQSRPNTHYM